MQNMFINVMYFWQMRVQIFQSYIRDLTDQNAILVKTVEDHEAEANVRVARLEAKLRKASDVINVGDNVWSNRCESVFKALLQSS